MGNMVKEIEENKMSMEFIAIISVGATMLGVGVALAGLIITGQNGLRREMQEQGLRLDKEIKEQRKEMEEQGLGLGKEIKEQGNRLEKEIKEQGEKHSNEITEVKNDLAKVKNDLVEVKLEVAALKATVETYFRVRVDPPQQAAVAEPPEDYDAG